jgi:cell wall-associated NlpC family hydrolase
MLSLVAFEVKGKFMARLIYIAWFSIFALLAANTGCAAQLRETRGITRVGYSIQVGAFAEVKNAERLTAKLQAKGIDAFYFRKDKGVYAVRFGDYTSRETARREARKLMAEKIIGDFFVASPDDAYLTRLKEPDVRSGTVSPPRPKAGHDMGAVAARTAERFVGIPYQWGGNNVVEGMDCSGFVRAVYNLCGVNIPRNSREQFRVGENVGRVDLKDGDLVFFGSSEDAINHVGIYVGNGSFVHAPRRGDEIKVTSLEDPYFAKKYVGARRYF